MVLDLFKASRQADEFCIVYCKCHANLHLGCNDAILVKLVTKAKRTHIVWMDASQAKFGIYAYVRAFHEFNEDADDDLSETEFREEIRPDQDVFCFNGSAYYLYGAESGNYVIRRLYAYNSQRVVEMMEKTEDHRAPIESVFLSNFYLFDGQRRNYACTCWGIVDKDGCSYLPVFYEDSHYVQDYDLSAFIREEIPIGGVFKNNGYYYKVLKDSGGKLYLEFSKLPFGLGTGACQTEQLPEQQPPKARVFYLDFAKSANR